VWQKASDRGAETHQLLAGHAIRPCYFFAFVNNIAMPKGDSLGEFEVLVLAALQRLGNDAYAVTVKHDIEQRAKRRASLGAIHAALGRLADKGYVVFRISDPLPIPGGRARKYSRITSAGVRALRKSTAALARMIDGLELGVEL
jgi:PadR family transcriptional regulator, regulatory protein PadR